eukprot:11531-Heterococcus_DN1.PRE.1
MQCRCPIALMRKCHAAQAQALKLVKARDKLKMGQHCSLCMHTAVIAITASAVASGWGGHSHPRHSGQCCECMYALLLLCSSRQAHMHSQQLDTVAASAARTDSSQYYCLCCCATPHCFAVRRGMSLIVTTGDHQLLCWHIRLLLPAVAAAGTAAVQAIVTRLCIDINFAKRQPATLTLNYVAVVHMYDDTTVYTAVLLTDSGYMQTV